jgi:hypothetical protein
MTEEIEFASIKLAQIKKQVKAISTGLSDLSDKDIELLKNGITEETKNHNQLIAYTRFRSGELLNENSFLLIKNVLDEQEFKYVKKTIRVPTIDKQTNEVLWTEQDRYFSAEIKDIIAKHDADKLSEIDGLKFRHASSLNNEVLNKNLAAKTFYGAHKKAIKAEMNRREQLSSERELANRKERTESLRDMLKRMYPNEKLLIKEVT